MKTFKKLLFYYGLGISLSLLCIGFIHLYSYIFETPFCFAEWDNILLSAIISAMPFGGAIWAFNNLKNTTK